MQPEGKDLLIAPDGEAGFYSTLPDHAASLEGEALSMIQGRMQATKDHLVETFQEFTGTVIYPCAHSDLRSALDLHKIFPKAQLVLNDMIDPNHISNALNYGERPEGAEAIIRYLRQRFQFDRTSEWQNRSEVKELAFKVKRNDERHPIFDVSFRIDTSNYNPACIPEYLSGVSRVNFEYRVTDLFKDESMPSGIVFLRRPGWQGCLMKEEKLWDRLSELIGDNRYLLAATDQGYRESTAMIFRSFQPLLIDPYVDQCHPPLPLFKIGGSLATQVFVKKAGSQADQLRLFEHQDFAV